MVAFPNPDGIEIHFAQANGQRDIGDLWEAAREAGVKPGTIHVWVTRKKIEPVLVGPAGTYFHLPTIREAAEARRKFKPADPATNSRRPHSRAA